MVSTREGHGGQRRNSGEFTWLTRESMMTARIFRGLESKQTWACAAHDSAPLKYTGIIHKQELHKQTPRTWIREKVFKKMKIGNE